MAFPTYRPVQCSKLTDHELLRIPHSPSLEPLDYCIEPISYLRRTVYDLHTTVANRSSSRALLHKQPPVMFKSPFGANANPFGGASDGATVGGNAMHQYNFSRRTSVSAESLKPSADTYDNWTPPVHDKTNEQLSRLKTAIAGNFLFSHLDDEQSAQILGALIEKPIPAKDIKVISQGDAGEYFYVVEKGSFDVYVNEKGTLQPGPEGMGEKVGTIQAGGSFGELALMYNAPRAATVISAEPGCTLWALDRLTFRRILMESTFLAAACTRTSSEKFPCCRHSHHMSAQKSPTRWKLRSTPLVRRLSRRETRVTRFTCSRWRGRCLPGEMARESVKHYSKGDFFGELALLNDAPRAASIVATTDVKVASLGKSAFQRLLGPVEGIMRRTKYDDIKTGVEEMDPLQV
uniref:cAMP-dependent protein kinase regulatory subunit n=1 Tax=Colletotrichum trifolii TaxID=5466 RepID=KAPR_COLTR|nr:RecName: Full=cAMP-dependent protein kinase regulatory subunit; Short=PKA regulatory subunit [Colletotrichum trifolii]AAC04356.1 cAMP-dependent protein kinase regulatory subunit [Colletotrichum trifolii]